jgi:hypothetical protein
VLENWYKWSVADPQASVRDPATTSISIVPNFQTSSSYTYPFHPISTTVTMSASGIAVSLNPNAPQEQQLQLFYNTKKHNLGVQLRNERNADDEKATYAAGDDAQAGIILNPGQVAASSVTGLDIVVGFTKKAAPPTTGDGCHCDPPNQNDVSIISPVYQPLAATQPNNLTIAATSSGSTAWIFFLT